jgi:hypothetical protein
MSWLLGRAVLQALVAFCPGENAPLLSGRQARPSGLIWVVILNLSSNFTPRLPVHLPYLGGKISLLTLYSLPIVSLLVMCFSSGGRGAGQPESLAVSLSGCLV